METLDTTTEVQEVITPKFLHHNTTIGGEKWICGTGNNEAKVMFVAPNVLEEEAKEEEDIGYGRTRPRTPRLTDCGHGVLFKRLALKEGIDLEDCWYTTIIKHLPENKQHRTRPPKSMLDKAMPFLEKEIEKIQPEIIVAVGKIAFDSLVDFKAKEDDVYGGWFYNKKYNAKIYLMPHITQVVKPEKHERYILDFRSIKTMLDSSEHAKKMPVNIHVIHNAEELKQLVYLLELMEAKVLSVDCEWEGHQHVDGKLRSLQIAWNDTDGAYIRFMDDKLNYVFDVPYSKAGEILGTWCNREDVKYIGHHVSADLMWMHHWLKLNWYKKAIFDSEFALQCCDESLDLGLDILALRYTDFGKYDWDLIWWRKQNPDKRGDGYGQVPDKILISYAVKDVLTVYRAWKPISTWLERQQLTTYYNEILNPFVTDVFTFFGLKGLPIDKAKMDKMRIMYQWAKRELEKDFKSMIAEEAHTLLAKAIATALGLDIDLVETILHPIVESVAAGKIEAARTALQQQLGAAAWMKVLPAFEHYIIAPEFNIRSKPQMQRWLFDVKKYTPVKSTANKAEGMPAVDWEKVMAYPEEKQRLFTPASDKGTLEILAARYDDQVIRTLLELNAVGNICKAFLREAEIDDDGELVAEKGLHAWLATDSAIHLQHSCTETGRPRSWNPNCLNWPSYISKRLQMGLSNILKKRQEQNQLPASLQHYAETMSFPTVRSVCMAKPGWCIVEADYQTAEMRGLAFISGDKDLMRMILEPDDCFGLPKPECLPEGIDAEDCVVRLKFPEYVHLPADKDKFLLTYAADGEIKATFTEDQLQRNPDGSFKGPRFDMHWGACELSRNTCREVMNKKKDRGAAKVVNFCLVGDTLVLTNHGEKPIKSVQGSDLLWDGVSWVKHKGIIKYDKKDTISYAGLTATPDHLVWTGRGVITLLEAAIRGATLTETAKAGIPIAYTGAACACRERKSKQRQQAKAVCASRMPSLWKGILEEFGKLSAWEGDAMSLQGAQKVQNNSECYFQTIRTALQLHDAKMLLWLAQTISRLQSQGYQSMLLIEGGVYSMGVQRLSGGNVSWEGIRSDRQRWGLLENKLTTCDELNKSFKYEKSITGQDSSGEILRAVSADPISPGYTKELDAARFIRRGDFRAFKALLQRLKDEDKVLQSGLQNDVYDIIDAGERHRFTANGYLVANSSSYGGTATSISRKIEADTGVKATPEEAQALLDAVEQRQPRATEFFKEMEQIPEAYGIIRAPSGRIRHCHTLAKDVNGMARTREGQLTALGRECRNFPMQESVGSSASRACVAMVDFHLRMKKHYGMQGYPCVCLYDSIVVHCPVEERQIWAKALDLFMNLSDGWYTAGGILRYPTDCEFNAGWSTKPDKEFKKQLYNQDWNPTPEQLKPVEEWLDAMIQLYTDNPELSVYNKQDIPNE